MNISRRIHTFESAAVATLVLALTAGCGSSGTGGSGASNQSASNFISEVTTQFARGQAGPLWDTLHPADQAVVSRARYMACQSNEGFNLSKIKVLQTYPDTVDIAGKPTPASAVSIKVTADDGITTATMHAVKISGRWRWILTAPDYASFAKGTCPRG